MARHRRTLDLLAITIACCSCGCATMIHGTTQTVRIETDPPGARVTILPDEITVVAPADVELDRKQVHTARARLDGYALCTGYVDRVTSAAIYGDILLGGLIGLSVDSDNGAAFRLTPDPLRMTLIPLEREPSNDSPP